MNLRQTFPLGVLVIVVASWSLGCATPSPATPESAGTSGHKVDRLVFAVEPPTRITNSNRLIATPYGWQLSPMHEHLITIDEQTGKNRPWLATSWSIEPDGKSIRFQLRRGVQFHWGYGEMTARDFPTMVAELKDRGADPDSFHTGLARFWDRVEGVDVVNDYEIVIRMMEPDSTMLNFLGEQVGGFEVYSHKHFEKVGTATMTTGPLAATGPYQFVERDQEGFVRLERVPYKHWAVTPDFPEFEYRIIREASTRLAALLAGEIHMAQLPEDLLQEAVGKGYQTVTGKVPAQRIFINAYCCQLRDPSDPSSGYYDPSSPYIDVRVRRALSKAINRDELNRAFYNGKAWPMYNNPWHPVREGWNPEWERRFPQQYGYDPEAARRLLAEAGYTPEKPAEVNLLVKPTPGVSSIEDLTEALAGYWGKIGVKVNLVSMDNNTVRGKSRNFELTNHLEVQGTSSDQWIGISVINSTLQRPATRGPQLLDVDAVLKEIARTVDDKKREALWVKAGNLAYDQHKFVPLFWLPVEAVIDPKVVSDWVFPGSITGNWTHLWNIKAAR